MILSYLALLNYKYSARRATGETGKSQGNSYFWKSQEICLLVRNIFKSGDKNDAAGKPYRNENFPCFGRFSLITSSKSPDPSIFNNLL